MDKTNLTPLILDVCCAPCLSGVYPQLKNKYYIIPVYNNDNICCIKEFDKRKDYFVRYLNIYRIKKYYILEYKHDDWLRFIKGYESEKEGGYRCRLCFEFRFLRLKEIFEKTQIKQFSTTLTISPYKNYNVIKEIGEDVAGKLNVKFLAFNFKKRDWYKKSIKISNALNLYRQKFCGCEFSLRDSLENKDKP